MNSLSADNAHCTACKVKLSAYSYLVIYTADCRELQQTVIGNICHNKAYLVLMCGKHYFILRRFFALFKDDDVAKCVYSCFAVLREH